MPKVWVEHLRKKAKEKTKKNESEILEISADHIECLQAEHEKLKRAVLDGDYKRAVRLAEN